MTDAFLGTDLLLYRGTTGTEAQRGEPDLQTRPGHTRPEGGGPYRDLAPVAGRDNLRQALINRLSTRRGELAALGHPTYGSRLYTLIGRPHTETARNLVKLFVLEALAEEPRIERRVRVAVTADPRDRTLAQVEIEVRPAAGGEAVRARLAFSFEGL
ncbi:MAG TPA: GPW/gp25 family protein [Chloroflexota bacterium]|nr:GPW/gp25 family protein [Chloroflexota bacterium]